MLIKYGLCILPEIVFAERRTPNGTTWQNLSHSTLILISLILHSISHLIYDIP